MSSWGPRTLHIVPWGHGGGYIYMYMYLYIYIYIYISATVPPRHDVECPGAPAGQLAKLVPLDVVLLYS